MIPRLGLVAGVGFVGPVKNIVVSGTRQGSYPILLVFSLVALASPSTGRARAPSPLPPPEVVEIDQISAEQKKTDPIGSVFFCLARRTEKDITEFLGKSACDKAFSDFFIFFLGACHS